MLANSLAALALTCVSELVAAEMVRERTPLMSPDELEARRQKLHALHAGLFISPATIDQIALGPPAPRPRRINLDSPEEVEELVSRDLGLPATGEVS